MHHEPVTAAPSVGLEQPDLYINRELSWIEFNRRVFEEAQDKRHPLLERVKFLSIFDTNLDEFFMIRLAGLKDQVAAHVTTLSPDGLTAEQQLSAVRQRLAPLLHEIRCYWRDTLLPELLAQGIAVLDYEQLDSAQRDAVLTYFEHKIFPVLTPLAFDAGHPFPHISNRSLNLAVRVHGERFARVKVPPPPTLPRLIPVPVVPDAPYSIAFVWIEQVIAAHLSQLFPGIDVWESYPFRVLRDADIELQADEAGDLLEQIEEGLQERRFGSVVDLAVNPSMPAQIRNSRDLFAAIGKHDLLTHQPYDSFNSVVEFIRTAADDSEVLAIKQTLYRVGAHSPVVDILKEAVEDGKQVAVLVELKARFDEENNIVWARELEDVGVHVVYGVEGLKTHAKIALVVRREADGLRRYVHLGTGNYNATTARIYEDLCLFTCRPDIGADASDLFNYLTGYSRQNSYRKFLVAPVSLRKGITERIEREMRHVQEQHTEGHLIFKVNALVDPEIITMLYQASQAGVQIDLIVRGICCLRPGIPGVSEHIRVRSILGRFLEHSRIFYFANGGDEEMYLGSADMMHRNLDERVETLFPLEDPLLRTAIRERLLDPLLADTVNASELLSDGRYVRVQPEPGDAPFDSQAWFISHPLVNSRPDSDDHTTSALPSGA